MHIKYNMMIVLLAGWTINGTLGFIATLLSILVGITMIRKFFKEFGGFKKWLTFMLTGKD